MKLKNILFILIILLFIPLVHSEDIHPMSTIAIMISAEDFKFQDVPIKIYSSVFENYCNLCDQNSACCGYCEVTCISQLKTTSSKGGISETILNFKFENDFDIEGGESCPSFSAKASEDCIKIDSNEKVWFSIEEYNYISEKYTWDDTFETGLFTYIIREEFKLTAKDKTLIEKSGIIQNKIISNEKIEDIIPEKEVNTINETVEEEKGIVLLKEEFKNTLKENIKFPIWKYSIIILVILVIILVTYLNKKRKGK